MGIMALLEVPEIRRTVRGDHVYVRPPEPIDFPSTEPLEERVPEDKRHLTLRTTLYLLLEKAFGHRCAIGSDQLVYWDPRDPRKCLSPDAFVKLGAQNDLFPNWKVWERGAPDLALEVVSKSDRPQDAWDVKLARYIACGVQELVRFDPAAPPGAGFAVWDRIEGDLVQRSPDDPNLLHCTSLGLWWVVVPSPMGRMLRLAEDREGNQLLLTPEEDERRARTLAEQERARAEQQAREAEQERASLAAEVERLRAELARRG